MPRYIDTDELLNTLPDDLPYKASVKRVLIQAPAEDVVEVVRCKGCKYFDAYEGEEHKGDCGELVGLESCVYANDFCSYGERKE